MEEYHKAQIAELEARPPGTPQANKEARAQAFRLASTQMKCRIDDAQSLLADATKTWSELDELPAKLELQQSIQNIEKATAAMKEEVKSLGAISCKDEEDERDEPVAIGSVVVKRKRDTI